MVDDGWYDGLLGRWRISKTDEEHEAAQARGELSCGPDMIDAVKTAREVFPGALVRYTGTPGAWESEQCGGGDDTSWTPREDAPLSKRHPGEDTTPVRQRPHTLGRIYAEANQADLLGQSGQSASSKRPATLAVAPLGRALRDGKSSAKRGSGSKKKP